MNFDGAFDALPLIAILRHLPVEEAASVGAALVDAGFTIVEVPLNNEALGLRCIKILADSLQGRAVVGAGTVTSPDQVERVSEAGGTLVVSPDTNAEVIAATAERGMVSCPGVATPTEALNGLRAGAHLLKLFPASLHGPRGLDAIHTILPAGTPMIAVGGVTLESVSQWRASRATGLGINTALYQPGQDLRETRRRASAFVEAWGVSG